MDGALRRLVLCMAAVASPLCVHAGGAAPGALGSARKPGTVLSEQKRDLGNGYVEIFRDQVNPPSHWEGIGHFAFVYFRGEKLCQCDGGEIAISPSGEFAIFADPDSSSRLVLFDAAGRSRKWLSSRYIGGPKTADWNVPMHRVAVVLEKYEQGHATTSRMVVRLPVKPGAGPHSGHQVRSTGRE